MHLHVGDLERGLAFYRDVLGFELVTLFPGQAAFVSAGAFPSCGTAAGSPQGTRRSCSGA